MVTCKLSPGGIHYKELVHEEVEHRPPLEILVEMRAIEQEILQGIEGLEGMLR